MLQSATLILTALLLQAPTPSLGQHEPERTYRRSRKASRSRVAPRTSRPSPRHSRRRPKSDVRAAMVAGLGRIGVAEVIPVLTQSLQTDLDKDVRLQVVDSFQRLYIPVDTTGPIETIFNKVKSVFRVARQAACPQRCLRQSGSERGARRCHAEGLQPGSARRSGARSGFTPSTRSSCRDGGDAGIAAEPRTS